MSKDLFAQLMSMDDTPEVREDYVRAPFPYPGSKSRSLSEILPRLPYRDRYAEPFGGTGSVLLARNESKIEIFNDRFSGVTSFFRIIRNKESCNELLDRLSLLIHSREEFIWCKKTWKNCENELERAARWFYTVCKSFGAQGRNFGRASKSVTSFSSNIWGHIGNLFPCHQRIKNVYIENQPWQQCFKDFDHSNMVWYLDPPYYEYAKGMYECEMSKDEHVELMERIQYLDGFVAISGYDNELYNKYKWDRIHKWQIHSTALGQAFSDTNNLGGKEDEMLRGKATEVLWIREAK